MSGLFFPFPILRIITIPRIDITLITYCGILSYHHFLCQHLITNRCLHDIDTLRPSYSGNRYRAGTKEWDTAAFQIIVEEAGGLVVEPNGKRLTYNREDVYNRNGYIVIFI